MFESNFENMFERTVLFEMLTLIHVCFIILLQHVQGRADLKIETK